MDDVNGHSTDSDTGSEHGSEEEVQVSSGARSEKEVPIVEGVAAGVRVGIKDELSS